MAGPGPSGGLHWFVPDARDSEPMLEAATWRTMNRRHFAVVETLYAQAGRPLKTDAWDIQNGAEYAAALTHRVGSYLLTTSISAATAKGQKPSGRRAGKAWKSVSEEDGARASVFLTLGVRSILSADIDGDGLDQQALSGASKIVEQTFAVPYQDQQLVEQVRADVVKTLNDELVKEAVERGGLADRMAIQRGQIH